MANQQPKQKIAKGERPKKFFLKSLYVDTPVTTEPEEPQKIVVAGLAEARIKKEYPDSFFGRATAVFRGELSTLVRASLFFILFTLPFILVLALVAGYFQTYILGTGWNFVGDIGIGYPGNADSISTAVSMLYWDVRQPLLMMLAGAGIIASVGMGGIFYCAKRSYFQDLYKKIPQTYFMGVGKYIGKFVLVSTFGILVTLAMGTALLYLLSQQALGLAGAGAYCAVVFSFIGGLPILAYCMVLLSLFTTYKMSLKDTMKDALVLIANNPLSVIITGALSSAPLLLLMLGNIFAIIIYLVMALFGCVFVALMWIGLANKGMSKCSALYALDVKKGMYKQVVGAKKTAKGKNPYANGNGNGAKTQKQTFEKKNVVSDAKQATSVSEPIEKKTQVKVQYQNPKKKKKK